MALKYRNKPVKVDGIKFASKLEKYCYDLLTGFKIPFEFQRWVDLTRPFEYYGEKIRPTGERPLCLHYRTLLRHGPGSPLAEDSSSL